MASVTTPWHTNLYFTLPPGYFSKFKSYAIFQPSLECISQSPFTAFRIKSKILTWQTEAMIWLFVQPYSHKLPQMYFCSSHTKLQAFLQQKKLLSWESEIMQSIKYETYFALYKLLLIASQSLLGIKSSGGDSCKAWKHMPASSAWPDALPTSFFGLLLLGSFFFNLLQLWSVLQASLWSQDSPTEGIQAVWTKSKCENV